MASAALRTAVLAACCLAVFGNANCRREPNANVFFPSSDEAAGWAKSSDIRTFTSDDLWKYIDGEAERYLKAGVQKVFTADYRFQNKVDATVDIYTMRNVDGAKKILDSEPVGDGKSLHLGDIARLYGQSLIFRKGLYLVRIVAYQESPESVQKLLELGQAVERRMTK